MMINELSSRWPAITATAIILSTAWVVHKFLQPNPLAKIPFLGSGQKDFMNGGGWKVYAEGYKKFKDGIFRITTSRKSPVLVMSTSFLPELQKLPDDVLSFIEAVNESMHGKYTGVDANVPSLPHTIRTSLTPSLLRLNPTIYEEVVDAMRLTLPQSSDWSEVKMNDKLLRIVAMVSGRVFVGPELCRDEAYLDASINYTIDLMTAVHIIGFTPVWLRPLASRLLPQVKKVQTRIKEAENLLQPIVAARQQAAKNPDYQKPDDMLQWLIDSQQKFGPVDDSELAKNQLDISFAAIHTTTMTTLNAFFSLAADPSLAPMLQEDVRQALVQSDGQYTNVAMQNMKKLDSFLKEVLRFYPLSASSFQRKVLKPFTLSNGQVIPAGVVIEVPSGGVSFDEDIHENAQEFDALRHYRSRMAKTSELTGTKAAEVVANSQFIGVGKSSLTFGYGRHACPGRFFAVNEIKMIMATALLNYEFKNSGGEVGRYPNVKVGSMGFPNPEKTILVRKL